MSGTVYFVSNDKGQIKIGFSKKLSMRLRALQTANPALTLLASLPGSIGHERAVHARLKSFRLKGEWFLDCREVRNYISDIIAAGIEPLEPRRPHLEPDADPFLREARELADCIVRYATGELHEIEQEFKIPSGTLWGLRYRPSKRLPMASYVAILNAAQAVLLDALLRIDAVVSTVGAITKRHQMVTDRIRFLESEIARLSADLKETIAGPDHAAVVAAEAVVGEGKE